MVPMASVAGRRLGTTVCDRSKSAMERALFPNNSSSVSWTRRRRFAAQAPKEAPKDDTSAKKSQVSWIRGYLGAHSNTDPPDAMFVGVATIVAGAGFYAWVIDPPAPNR